MISTVKKDHKAPVLLSSEWLPPERGSFCPDGGHGSSLTVRKKPLKILLVLHAHDPYAFGFRLLEFGTGGFPHN